MGNKVKYGTLLRDHINKASRNAEDLGARKRELGSIVRIIRETKPVATSRAGGKERMYAGYIGDKAYAAVAARAVDAALHDPRFLPVSESELPSLRVEVSALTPPKPVASWREIVLGRDGMTLEKDGRFAVFLPQVAPEQGWDLPTTLSYLAQKAGLPENAWRDGAAFETFQAEVFHE